MNNERTIIANSVFLCVAILMVLGIVLLSAQSSPSAPTQSPAQVPTQPATPTTSTSGPTYTLAQVAIHASSASCWSVVNTGVYNLTAWINLHPGGSETILSMCGTDATAAFTMQHGGKARPEAELASYKIGTLTK